ncbi:MAG: response regulator transcription factor [Bacteroidales bacterium]|jgi:two-component system alkaline phosphatase synthesis response regulator PhoP
MDKEAYKILIVDDESDILEFLSYNLKREGYTVFTARNGKSAIDSAQKVIPHLILLDVMMPDMDGIETCEKIRDIPELNNSIIAFLTARGEDYSQIAGFEAGGDDYIQKPIKPKVLTSRIRALLKRSDRSNKIPDKKERVLKKGNITIDREKYLVFKNNEELILPKKEFELLLLLSSKPGKVFTRDEIFQSVWEDNVIVGDRTIDVHIRKLREKIGDDFIKTIKGVGYKFAE